MDSLLSRRQILAAALAGAVPDLATAQFPNRSRSQGSYFEFQLAGQRFVGRDQDPLLPGVVFDCAARYLEHELNGTKGVMKTTILDRATKMPLMDEKGNEIEYKFTLPSNNDRLAIDFTKVLTRVICRERYTDTKDPAKIAAPAAAAEVAKAIDKVLTIRHRHEKVPFAFLIYGADDEDSGLSFGGPQEVALLNKINKASGIPPLKGPFRKAEEFLEAIRHTLPVKLPDGSLYFSAMFNGHGAPGGKGVSLHSNGASQLASALLSGHAVVSAYEYNCKKNKDMLLAAHEDNVSVYMGLIDLCCFSKGQVTKKDRRSPFVDAKGVLSRLEYLQKDFKVRPYVFTGSEVLREGLYQPRVGAAVPVLALRALVNEAIKKNNKLTFADIYDEIVSGKGSISNPTLFAPDVSRPRMFQIGARESNGIIFDEKTLCA